MFETGYVGYASRISAGATLYEALNTDVMQTMH